MKFTTSNSAHMKVSFISAPQIECGWFTLLWEMDYKVANEKELIAALKKIAVKDGLEMSDVFYYRQREYIKLFRKNREFSHQEAPVPPVLANFRVREN